MPHQAGTTDGEIGTAAAAAAATAAAGPAWRQFSFFESSPVRDLDDFSKAPSALRHPNEVAAVCQCPVRPPASVLISSTDPNPSSTAVVSTSVHFGADPSQSAEDTTKSPKAERKQPCTLVGTIQGRIKVLDPETFQELSTWDAFSSAGVAGRVTHLSCDTRGRVVSLGEEESSRFPILRIWDLRSGRTPSNQTAAGAESNDASTTTQKVAWMPRLLAEGKVQHGSRPHPIAAVTHTPSLSYLSVALADGTVLLIRGLESALMSAASNAGIASAMSLTRPTPAIALPKFKVVFQPTSSDSGAHEPVTALGFSEAAAPITVHTTAASKKDNSGGPAYEPRVMHSSRGRKGAASRSRDPRNASNANSAATTQPETTVLPSAVHLFIVTLSRVLRYVVAGKGAGGSPAVLDDVGGALGCAAVIPPRSSPATPGANASGLQLSETQSNMGSAGKMVIARNEAIYVIGQEGREACFAYEGPKSSIHLSASQVIIVSPPYTPSTSASSSSARNLIGNRDSPLTTPTSRKGSMIPAEIAKVTIFDLDNKLVAFTGTFETGIREAWVGSAGEVLILADTGELTRLDEKPLRAKLDVLYRKSLFLLAVNLARSHMQSAANQDVFARTEALMGDIYQRYGDHLYNKGDYDGAMAQYVKTIGHTQPSFVIRRFLDAQRITNLTTYLQELHTQNLASSDHTTLLLNCYTKLKDVASLDKFIKRPHVRPSSAAAAADEDGVDGEGAAEDRDELPFDLETAMRVCRQAGYFGHAAYLAKRYGEHREYLRIQIEDAKDYSDALLYVRGLEAEDAIASMVQYAKTLLGELPDETTELLIELCSGAFRPDPDAAQKAQRAQHEESEAKEQPTKSAAAAYLSYLQVGGFGKTNNSADATTAGSAAGASSRAGTGSNTPARRNSTALVEPYTVGGEGSGKNATRPSSTVKITGEVDADASSGDAADASGVSGVNTEQDKMDAYPVPSPRTYFAHFIQHRQHFTRFLEVVALARWGQVVNMDGELPADHTLSPVQAKNAPAYSEKAGGEEDMDDVERALRELGLDSNDEDAYENQELLDQKSIWNTLLELYLSSCSPSGSQRQRALRLLQQHSTLPYDMSHAVMLCSMENFDDGLILLYERMGMYEEVVRLHMDSALVEEEDASGSSSGKVIAALARYGSLQPELYDLVLRFLVSSPILLSRHTSDLLSILNVIREKSLMSTLEIVQTLSSTPHTQVGVIRDFIISSISSTLTSTSHDAAAIADYKQSTTETLREISELTDAGGTRVFQMTRCTACGGQLDLPSVHFMCKHSYHQRCLGEEEAECGACAVHQRRVRDARRRMAQEAVEVIEKARHDGPTQIRLRADHTDAEAFDQLAAWFGLPIMGVAHAVEM